MRQVVLSVDYEIFGNGAGDVRQHITGPTERMARMCERHQSPLTVFVEMEETLAFSRHAAALRTQLRYDPFNEIRQQVGELAKRGHDFQLHLHPEWYGAEPADGGWRLREEKATVDSLFTDTADAVAYIGERKVALESLSGKPVVAYRAGAFSAQPSVKLIPALAHNGIVLDTSVVRGSQRRDEHVHLDYRNAPAGKHFWRVERDVAVDAPRGSIWEVPIASKMGRRLNQLTWGRLKAKFSSNVPKAQQSRLVKQLGVRRNPLAFLFQRVPIKFDFHNVAPSQLVRWIRDYPAPPSGGPDIVVLIGHTKEHIDDAGFDRLVGGVKEAGMKIVSLTDIAAQLQRCEPAREPQLT